MIAGAVLAVLLGIGAAAVVRTRRAFKAVADDRAPDPATEVAAQRAAVRLTSGALRSLPAPPWRVVYEVAAERLTGAEHVLIGPPGAFAVTTTIDPLPPAPSDTSEPIAVARAAMTRGGLDDTLTPVRLASRELLVVHWGGAAAGAPPAVPGVHGVTHLDGRRLAEWAAALPPGELATAQIDQAWQAVTLAIGRPDPLG